MKKKYAIAITSVFHGKNEIFIREANTPDNAVFDALESAGWEVDRSKSLTHTLDQIEDIVSSPIEIN